jgi:hypothetical protein
MNSFTKDKSKIVGLQIIITTLWSNIET